MRADIADVYPVVFRKEMDSVVSEFKMQAEYLIPAVGQTEAPKTLQVAVIEGGVAFGRGVEGCGGTQMVNPEFFSFAP